jgi:hypothetical protein
MLKRLSEFRFLGQPLDIVLPLTLIFFGVISITLLLIQRNRWDEQYRDVIACLDYNAVLQLSEVSNEPVDLTLTKLRTLGYSSIAVSELTVLAATDKGCVFETPDELLVEWAATNKPLADLMPDLLMRRNFCILGKEREEAARERLELVYNDNFISVPIALSKLPAITDAGLINEKQNNDFNDSNNITQTPKESLVDEQSLNPNGWFLVSIPREAEVDFNKVSLGFDPAEWRTVRGAGFDVVPRLVNNPKYDASDIKEIFENLDEVSKSTVMPEAPSDYRTVLFEGDAVPGYPFNVAATANEINKREIYFGWIEFEIQDGAGGLASKVSPNVVLTHSISAEEMIEQTAPVARSRFIRALKERNVRLIYIRPFFTSLFDESKEHQAVAAYEFNTDYLKDLQTNIVNNSFKIAREPYRPPFDELHLLKMFVVFGLIGMTTLALRIVIQPPKWVEPAFWIAAIVGSLGLYVIAPKMLYSAWALVSAIVAPLLGSAIALAITARSKPSVPTRFLTTLSAYVSAIAVTALGGMAVYSLINSANAFVKTEAFRGVMLSLAVPVLFIAVYAWDIRSFVVTVNSRIPGWIARLNALLDRKIEFVDMLIVFLGLAAIALILMRSGNEAPIGVAQMELVFRERLEDLLVVRPRTKEIVGLPALFFFLAYFHRRKPPSIVLLLIGAVALTSIVNTFCHLHTPIAVSLVRTLFGTLLGFITGSLAYFAYQLYLSVTMAAKNKTSVVENNNVK